MEQRHLILAAMLMLAACDKGRQEEARNDSPAINAAIADNVVEEPPRASNSVAPEGVTMGKVPSPAANTMPVSLQGRWGMVPKDCGPDAAIAKGLMTINGAQLRFYESVAKPAVVTYPTPNRMEGRFSFMGEGMEWSKDMTLTVEGDTLVRTEKDPQASYRYTRCPA